MEKSGKQKPGKPMQGKPVPTFKTQDHHLLVLDRMLTLYPETPGFLNYRNAFELLVADDAVLFAAVDATPKVIRSVTVNKSPALLSVPTPSAEQLRRAEIIANTPEFRTRVGQALAARFPEDPAAPLPPVEKQIFGGFYSDADKALLVEFQRADWPIRQEITATIIDPRLRQLGRRLVAFYAPELLSPDERGQYRIWLEQRWSAPDVPETEWTSRDRAHAALTQMRSDGGIDAGLMDEIEAYLLQSHP